LTNLANWFGPILYPFATAGIVLILTIFILLEREQLRARLVQLLASANPAVAAVAVNQATEGISRFLRTMFLINVVYGAAVAVATYLIGLPNPLLWGVLGFGFRFLPYIGPWLAGVIPIALSLVVFDDWARPLVLIGVLLVFELTVNTILEPWLFGRSTGISSLGIVVAVLFWGWLWGPMGILLAIPITLWLVVLGRHIPALSFFDVLFGDRTSLPSYHDLYQRLLTFDTEDSVETLEKYLESNSIGQVFDRIIVPLLQRVEVDRGAGHVSKSQLDVIRDVIESTVDWTPAKTPRTKSSAGAAAGDELQKEPPSRRILIAPVSTRHDEIGAKALARALSDVVDLEAVPVSTALLAIEIEQRLREESFDAIVVTGIDPYATAKATLIAKRIRRAFPNLLIILGLWKPTDETRGSKSRVDVRNQQFDSLDETVAFLKSYVGAASDREESEPSNGSRDNLNLPSGVA
jgi:hypothetical protein